MNLKNKLFYSLISIFSILFCYYNLKNYNNSKFLYIYSKSLLFSQVIFILSSFFQIFLIFFNIIKPNNIRCGFIGIYQRFFLFFRTIGITLIWLNYLEIITKKWSFSFIIYFLIKIFLIFYLIIDFIKIIKIYFENKYKILIDAKTIIGTNQCAVCYEELIEPKLLPCGHIFCYSCLIQCASIKKLCPLCRKNFQIPIKIDMSNGWIPFTLFFTSI